MSLSPKCCNLFDIAISEVCPPSIPTTNVPAPIEVTAELPKANLPSALALNMVFVPFSISSMYEPLPVPSDANFNT